MESGSQKDGVTSKHKKYSTALLLAFFLGTFGAHHFYLRRFGWGVVYLLFSETGIPIVVSWVEMAFLKKRVDHINARQYLISQNQNDVFKRFRSLMIFLKELLDSLIRDMKDLFRDYAERRIPMKDQNLPDGLKQLQRFVPLRLKNAKPVESPDPEPIPPKPEYEDEPLKPDHSQSREDNNLPINQSPPQIKEGTLPISEAADEKSGAEKEKAIWTLKSKNVELDMLSANLFTDFAKSLYSIERELILLFENEPLSQQDCLEFARSQGCMLHLLIDSINEKSFELLGDILIEEMDHKYVLGEEFEGVLGYVEAQEKKRNKIKPPVQKSGEEHKQPQVQTEETPNHAPVMEDQNPLPSNPPIPSNHEMEVFFAELHTDEREFVKLFITQSEVPLDQCLSFAREKGLMLTKFVDGINEKAVESLGDVFLEESNRAYILSEEWADELTQMK
ncbi:TerB-like protein [Melghirimyces profundicolus]|uniref:TerB-like protein n=1 Tax=Melghirimyces profundicolus TaxID=1242148 RepID=A0A2T6B9E9_9BACL|nr:tellurite resistance TerB C-terminal domain-containing protein [Melghirimyces profundicolus]PTX52705.1 TerB-like protein [Melghirimyces profundicolus]